MQRSKLCRSRSARPSIGAFNSSFKIKQALFDRSMSADNIPRTISLGFVEKTLTTFEETQELWEEVDQYMMCKRRNAQCSYGLLFECIDPKERFPLVTYHVFHAPKGYLSGRYVSQPDLWPINDHMDTDSTLLDGIYSELFPRGDIRQLGISVDRTLQVYDQNSIFIMSCFMADQHHTSLDNNWFSWTGASLLLGSLPSSIQIKGIWFYKQQPGSVTGLTYVMVCEVLCEPEKLSHLRQFIYFMKLRQCGYIDLYRLRLAV